MIRFFYNFEAKGRPIGVPLRAEISQIKQIVRVGFARFERFLAERLQETRKKNTNLSNLTNHEKHESGITEPPAGGLLISSGLIGA